MAGALATKTCRVVKTFGVAEVISIMSFPVLGYIYLQQEKQFAWLDEQERIVDARYKDLRSRGIIRDR